MHFKSCNAKLQYLHNLVMFQIRVGLPGIHAYGMEDMLYKYGVDIHIQAHEHTYERFWPVYNLTVSMTMSNHLSCGINCQLKNNSKYCIKLNCTQK